MTLPLILTFVKSTAFVATCKFLKFAKTSLHCLLLKDYEQ
jgi:hypothetical protein